MNANLSGQSTEKKVSKHIEPKHMNKCWHIISGMSHVLKNSIENISYNDDCEETDASCLCLVTNGAGEIETGWQLQLDKWHQLKTH